jgi:hypothetical protein
MIKRKTIMFVVDIIFYTTTLMTLRALRETHPKASLCMAVVFLLCIISSVIYNIIKKD